jgi:hypothetical protein
LKEKKVAVRLVGFIRRAPIVKPIQELVSKHHVFVQCTEFEVRREDL